MKQAALDRAQKAFELMDEWGDAWTYLDLMRVLGFSQQEAQRALSVLLRSGHVKRLKEKIFIKESNRSVAAYQVRRKKYDAKAVQRALIQQPFCPYCGRKGGSLS